MSWAPGGSLRARLRGESRGSDPLMRAPILWLRELVETLADVHAQGWVHGDVKPANVLFDGDDRPLFGDFGIARRRGEPNTPGSAGYVAPERSAGAPCSPSDDVYGIGRLMADVTAAGWSNDARLIALSAACTADASARPPDAAAVLAELAKV